MGFRFIKSHAKRTGAIIASLACAIGAQTFCLPMAHADETNESVSVKQVNLGKKIAADKIVETNESMVFAAPKSIKDSKMRYIQIAQYVEGENGAKLVAAPKLSKLISQYLSKKGYKNFNEALPLQSELESQAFIFSKVPSSLSSTEAKKEKAKISKAEQAFAFYLEKLCSENKVASSSLPLTYSPTHPAAVAALPAGGYLFYSANNTFLPQVVFSKGAKIKDLLQSDFVELNPVSSKDAEKGKVSPKSESKKGKADKKINKTAQISSEAKKAEAAKAKSGANGAKSLKKQEYLQAIKKSALIDTSAPMVHVLNTGMHSPDYLWAETGTWITNPEDMSFSVGEMNPISYQVGTEFPQWEQMATLKVYGSTFDFTVTPGAGESIMLNTIQVGGETPSTINSEEEAGAVTVSWGGNKINNLNQTVEGDGKTQLRVALNWYALHYLRWNGAGINPSDGSSTGYGTLSIYYGSSFALDFIGYLNRDVVDTSDGVSLGATITGEAAFNYPETSPQSSVAVYTNGTPNGTGQIGSSFALDPENGINNADSYGSPTPQTTNAGLWWKEEFPDGSCNGKVTKGAKFTVATLADTLYTGPGSDPSSGDTLSNGQAYLEPAGGNSQNPLQEGPSGSEFAGWSFGSDPVEYSSVYAGTSSPSLQENSGLFEIGGLANGVYIVSQTTPA
ncbi:MAG: hypothetical protein J6S25_00945, partial [Aeriscardovia sp.]|nr:hypothetical protein [Aeriscardovia sp.]